MSFVPSDGWITHGIHWHGYVHLPDAPLPATRLERLRLAPHAVLFTPDDVADWLDEVGTPHVHVRAVLLIEGGVAETTDSGAFAEAWVHDQLAASEARCVYVRHGTSAGPVLLYAEVIRHDACGVAAHQATAA